MLLEALGREISGDAPLVATCVGAAAVVDCEPAAGAEEAPRVAISRRGSPDGRIAHELVYLLRVLQHSSGKAWTQVVGKCLYAALQLAPNAVECLRGEGATGDEAHDEALPEVASRATWLVLGTLSVCGGHVDGIQPGSRVLLRTEGSRALASVLDANSTSARVIIHAPPLPLISRRLDLDDLLPTPEIEPSVAGLPLQQLLPQIAALLPTRPTQRSTLTEVAMGTATPAPLLGVIHSRAAKAIHVLLAGTTHAEVATALLGSAAFPRLLDLATTSVPYFQPAKGSRAQLGFTEALALELDATLLDAMPAAADVRSTLRGARCTVPTLRLGVHLADELTDEDHLLDLCALGLAPTTCAEALSASGGHVIDAAHRLLNVNDAAGAGEAEKQNSALIAQLEAMGFPYELCAYSLNRAANDLQRAAEYLLEGGQLPEGTSHASGGSGSRGGGDRSAQASESASGGGSTPFQPGVPVELNDEADPSRWHEAQVLECTEHAVKAALTMLCEFGWLRTADEDEACSFALKDLDGLLAPIVRLLKLTCVAEPCADDHAADSDALNMVCATLSNLLTDTALLEGAPSFQALPSMLGYECVRFLARAATSAQHAESSHPSECADRIVPLACPGASSMHLQFDCRTWLSRGSTLGVYLDVGCTQEVFSFDADDLIASETLVVPVERVWLKYHAHQNRDNAWGFKVHAQPARWRVCNEVALVEGPFEFGWELLQLLVEEAPPVIAEPELLANLLRYVLHGRAPHKERACLLLLKALPHVHLGEPPFDHAVFLAIEQHVGWHDMLLKQHLPLEGTALLPCATQCMLDLLVECRERLTSMSPPAPWISSLPCMSEVSELSALTKWLLMPSEYACPRTSLRLAARSSGEQSVDPRAYDKWTTSLDAQLVDLVSKAHHGSSALNLRATQIATISEAAREASSTIRAWSHGQVSMRLGLLQRFNQLLTRNIATVHTGMPRKLETLGGRLCMLRGAILLETKLNALEQALASTVSDVDATPVVLNRFKASRLRARAEADHSGVGTLFVQLQEQLGRIKPRALFRHDKAFRANLSGENADDHGGPYREALAHIVTELQSDALPLLIRCPNGQNGVGEHRDTYVPNPSATSSVHMEWYYFLGQLFGLALRQKETQLGLSLPSVVWKQLVAEGMDGSDLANFDAMCKQSLDKLRDIDKEGVDAELFADVIFETFTTQLSDGSEVALLPNGSAIDVTFDNRHEFCDAVRQARLHEAQHQCDAILQGLSYVVPQRVLTLFTWQQLELLTCGSKEIDLEMLRTKTKYGVGVSPSQRHVRYLWQTLRRFSPENRALFLRFVWGRTRLPATPGEWGDVRFTLHTRHSGSPDNSYPVAHTCFFSLELPAYTSLATCHEKILYAITNCQNIDIDTTTSARENRERGVEEDDGDDGAGPSAIDEVRI